MCLDAKHKLCGYKGVDCSNDPPLVKQEFVKESDVNVIIARCLRSGAMLPGAEVVSAFSDVSEIGDFAAAQSRIVAAQEAFMALDANVRSRFHNDPAELLSFIVNDANRPEAEKLGLVAPRKEKEPVLVAPVLPANSPVLPAQSAPVVSAK